MGNVEDMWYVEMNDATDINLDLHTFISMYAKADIPGAKSREQEYNFVLEFKGDEQLRELLMAISECGSGMLTPRQT
jgi:hypothetical protein